MTFIRKPTFDSHHRNHLSISNHIKHVQYYFQSTDMWFHIHPTIHKKRLKYDAEIEFCDKLRTFNLKTHTYKNKKAIYIN